MHKTTIAHIEYQICLKSGLIIISTHKRILIGKISDHSPIDVLCKFAELTNIPFTSQISANHIKIYDDTTDSVISIRTEQQLHNVPDEEWEKILIQCIKKLLLFRLQCVNSYYIGNFTKICHKCGGQLNKPNGIYTSFKCSICESTSIPF